MHIELQIRGASNDARDAERIQDVTYLWCCTERRSVSSSRFVMMTRRRKCKKFRSGMHLNIPPETTLVVARLQDVQKKTNCEGRNRSHSPGKCARKFLDWNKQDANLETLLYLGCIHFWSAFGIWFSLDHLGVDGYGEVNITCKQNVEDGVTHRFTCEKGLPIMVLIAISPQIEGSNASTININFIFMLRTPFTTSMPLCLWSGNMLLARMYKSNGSR